jgi:hypothetical protein
MGILIGVFLAGVAAGAPVSEKEAIAVAELWYTMEINASTTDLPPVEKQQRVAARSQHQAQYLVGRDDLKPTLTPSQTALAYVVSFKPSGFVIVSGDDAMQPVLVFNATGSFAWAPSTDNYSSYFLGRAVVSSALQLRAQAAKGQPPPVHANWVSLRQRLAQAPGLDAEFPAPKGPKSIFVFWPTASWSQWAYYNKTCVGHNGGTWVPTGCTATAMAIKMRFHEWPPSGAGSHDYTDNSGTCRYYHTNNFGVQSYNWAAMPTGNLTSDNADVADLMYACGVAVEMDYEPGASGAWPSASSMNTYFRYRGTIDISSGNPADHFDAIAYSVRCNLPVVLSTTSHTMVASGYRDSVSPYFYINAGHDGGSDGWYDLNLLPAGDPTIDKSCPYCSPSSFTYVDSNYSGTETGDLQTPYNTVTEGKDGVTTGGTVWLKAGPYRGPGNTGLSLSKPMLIRSYLGTASVGGS